MSIKDVRHLSIDGVYLGRKFGYITVVRGLISGSVLYVGKGKGGDALKKFRKRLKRRAGQIRAVSMDMSNAYAAWVKEALPDADLIFDHFHLVKLMNDTEAKPESQPAGLEWPKGASTSTTCAAAQWPSSGRSRKRNSKASASY